MHTTSAPARVPHRTHIRLALPVLAMFLAALPAFAAPAGTLAEPRPPRLLKATTDASTGARIPVAIDEKVALASAAGTRVDLAFDGGEPLPARYVRHREFASGDLLWVGRVETPRGTRHAVITFGRDGAFGAVPTADGRLLALRSRDGESWLEPMNAVNPAPACVPGPCAAPPARDTWTPPTPKSAPAVRVSDAQAEAMAASGAPVRIDVLGIYTADVVRITGSDAAAQTYFRSLVELANQAYVDSGVNARFEIVRLAYSTHDTNMATYSTLIALQNNQLSDGLDVHALREESRADLVSMLRDGAAHREVGGVGNMTGSPTQLGVNYGYSVSAFGGYVMAHEMSHNLGAAHDRDTDTNDDGSVTHGAYPYAHGHKEDAPYPFYSIMAYGAAGQREMPYYAGPDVWKCRGRPCGLAEVADNVRALNLMAPRIALLRNPPGSLAVMDAELLEPSGQAAPAHFQVRLAAPAPAGGLVFRAWTEDGTASAGSDYTALAPTDFMIPEGEVETRVPVTILSDDRVEPGESFTLVVEPPGGIAGHRVRGEGRIENDDPRIELGGRLSFDGPVPTTGPIYVTLRGGDGANGYEERALYPPDFDYRFAVVPQARAELGVQTGNIPPYVEMSTEIAIGDHDLQRDIVLHRPIAIAGRLRFSSAAPPPTGEVSVVFWGANGIQTMGRRITTTGPDFAFTHDALPGARVRVTVGDPPAPFAATEVVVDGATQDQSIVVDIGTKPTIRVDDFVVDEGGPGEATRMWFNVSVATDSAGTMGAPWGALAYRWRVVGGTAVGGSDYTGTSGSSAIGVGVPNDWFYVTVAGDDVPEADETIEVEIYDAPDALIADARATGLLRDDDRPEPPALRIADTAVQEGDAGTRTLTFDITASPVPTQPVSFDIGVVGGTAGGDDFAPPASTRVVLQPGQSRATWSVAVLGDTRVEGDETLVVELSAADGATLARGRATGRVLDDDGAVAPPASDRRGVDADTGMIDLVLSNLPALPDARFLASALVPPKTHAMTIAADATPADPYDAITAAAWRAIDIPAVGAGETRRWILHAQATSTAPLQLHAGDDADADGDGPDAADARCARATAATSQTCEVRIERAPGSPATQAWVLVTAATDVAATLETALVPLEGDGTLVATGPGRLPAASEFPVRLGWDDPTWLPGEARTGYLFVESRAGEPVYSEPLRFVRDGSVVSARVLAPGQPQRLRLAAGQTLDRLVFEVPPYATAVRFTATPVDEQAAGSLRLEARHQPTVAEPVIAPAPGGAALRSAGGDGLAHVLALDTALLQGRDGRWYVSVANTGAAPAEFVLTTTLDVGTDAAAAIPGSYYNAQRGGHGLFLYPAGDQWAGLWYTYLEDRTPTWYYLQAEQPGADGIWRSGLYRAAWNGAGNRLTPVGQVVVTPGRDGTFSYAVSMDGYASEQTMTPFLTGCPEVNGQPLSASAHWFEPALSGYGYSVQASANYEFIAAFIYDEVGVPRFLAAERGDAFAAASEEMVLYQLRGFAPLGAHTVPDRIEAGRLQRRYLPDGLESIGIRSAYTSTVPGEWTHAGPVTALSARQGCAP